MALAGALGACATIDAISTQYIGAPRPAPTDPAQVAIVHAVPTQPHDGLGEIIVDASTSPAPPVEDVEGRLRAEAARMGADAVLIVVDRIQPIGTYVYGSYWGPSFQPVTGRRVVGVAIKYRS
jgi:hypothetical protein